MSVVVQRTPQAGPGSAVVRILTASVLTYAGRVYSGQKPNLYPVPFVPDSSAVGRIAAVGPDATRLKPGQLVYLDSYVHGRDKTSSLFLHGLSAGLTPGSNALMENGWRDGTYAEYAKLLLENCFPMDEARLFGSPKDGGMGYTVEDMMYLFTISIAFGGLRDADVKAGEKVIITPATGAFSSAAFVAALAMGPRVVAMGRSREILDLVEKFGSFR